MTLVPALQHGNASVLPVISAIAGANPCVRPVFSRYSSSLHGQARGLPLQDVAKTGSDQRYR